MKYHGIAVYEIIDNWRILSGIGVTDVLKNATIGCDIAIFQDGAIGGNAVYKGSAMDNNNKTIVDFTLTITLRTDNVYDFEWKDATGKVWNGIGLKAGNNHIAVSYSHP